MKLTMRNLEEAFNTAIERRAKYVAVKIQMKNLEAPEVIINPYCNLEEKLKYYKVAYNEELCLRANTDIKIVGFTYSDLYSEIEYDLV